MTGDQGRTWRLYLSVQIRKDEAISELDLVQIFKGLQSFRTISAAKERGKYGPFGELAWEPMPKEVEDNVLKASFASVSTTNISFQESQIPEISLQL